ncbi:MAG: GGDEF domain-containing protein [Spongiibacteraceae bacterium]
MSTVQQSLFALLDYFSNPRFGKDNLRHSRALALVGINLSISLALLVGVAYTLIMQPFGENSSFVIFTLQLPVIVFNCALLFVLRTTGRLEFCQHSTLLATFAAVVTNIYVTGGPAQTPHNQLMIMQAILAFFLLGIRGGLAWSVVILFTQSFLYFLSFIGVEFPLYQLSNSAIANPIFNWLFSFVAILSLILLIELSRGRLELKRHTESERLRYIATHDSLTQLANRDLFENNLKLAILDSQKNNSKVLLLYLDLDKFKPINDQWGHDVGDQILKIIAARLKTATREQDTAARLGGDEFALLLPNMDKDVSINTLGESIYQRVTQPILLHGKQLEIDCSIGICSYPEQASSSEQLWQQADAAMYIAKKQAAHWYVHRPDNDNIVGFC